MSATDLYFDHGATSHPKPPAVAAAVAGWIAAGGTYGRAAYGRALAASRLVEAARDAAAGLFGVAAGERVIFTPGATWSVHLALAALVAPGARVLVSPLEHNAVMRGLALRGAAVETLPALPDGTVDVARVPPALEPEPALVVCVHQSNVNGVVQPVAALKRAIGRVPLLVDAAQSAGELPIAVDADGLDCVAVSGHKGLLGLPGSGLLLLGPGCAGLPAAVGGGTGSRSESFAMPGFLPDRLEPGTPNLPGIVALGAGIAHLRAHPSRARERALELLAAFRGIPGLEIHAAAEAARQGALFSFNIEGMSPSAVAERLYRESGIECRAGLHCAPAAHRHLGTLGRGGTVRVAPGPDHDEAGLAALVAAVGRIARGN